jgi:hypothetical protein
MQRGFALVLMVRIVFILCLLGASVMARDFQGASHVVAFDDEPFNYSKSQPDSAISKLQAKLDSGDLTLSWDDKYGYLPALLKALQLPVSSQTLVFSKTSMQHDYISPSNPRALYFNDSIYLGWIPGAPLVEISVTDPKLGALFYSLDNKKIARPKFRRNDQCLECHASSKSMGVPGLVLRSFMTDEDGQPDLSTGISQVNHCTPIEERWGGWYVTGTHGKQTHRGNLIGSAAFERQEKEPNYAGNCTNLSKYFSVQKYIAGTSDIVALMVLEHQTHMHNYITRLNYEATLALKTYGHVNYLKSIVESFVRYMLFAEEAPFKSPIKGTSGFQQAFEALGPADHEGRSLRQFDLKTRLFKYPCSFLIYSDEFDQLPKPVKDKIYARLYEILRGTDESGDYDLLTEDTRKAILDILRETKTDLPDNWKERAISARD